jgi:class 3 adenylate cyclase
LDSQWRYAYLTDELQVSYAGRSESTTVPIGSHFFSAASVQFRTAARIAGGSEYSRLRFLDMGRYMLASAQGGREELRRLVDPRYADLVDELQPQDLPAVSYARGAMTFAGTDVGTAVVLIRIDDKNGDLAGVCIHVQPGVGMSQLAAAAATADLAHLERMRILEHPDRRQAAILMADLEASSALARRLSSAQYFAFVRRLVRATDQCIIDAGGIVGRHAGDGVVAFFLTEAVGSESAAARACVTTARTVSGIVADVAMRSEIAESELTLRFGLHWGATLYVGGILTAGRSEITALGDEMNEAARIEASATGGRILASKSLIERLNRADAQALGLDPGRATYTPLAELATASDKARRDAPAIAVCDITDAAF